MKPSSTNSKRQTSSIKPIYSSHESTLKSVAEFEGVGVHSGEIVRLRVCPVTTATGILFKRVDQVDHQFIQADARNVSKTDLSTELSNGVHQVSTVEHLLSACYGFGIDHAVIEIDGPEVPILDGSSLPFFKSFCRIGKKALDVKRTVYVLQKPVEFEVGHSKANLKPSENYSVSCEINFDSKIIGRQTYDFEFSFDAYSKIMDSRTFCMMKEIEFLQSKGLCKGGSLQNAIVIDELGVLNKEGLRSPNEFVKHKLLDAVGDLSLMTKPLIAHVDMVKPGHEFNTKLANFLLENKKEYLVEIEYDQFIKMLSNHEAREIAVNSTY